MLLWRRHHLGSNPLLTFLTVGAIASSVSLAVAVELISRSMFDALERSSRALAGPAQVHIFGFGRGLSEELLSDVRQLPTVVAAFAMTRTTVRAGPSNLPIHVLGIDLTRDRRFDLEPTVAGVTSVGERSGVIVASPLARRLGILEGDSLTLYVGSRVVDVRVRGVAKRRGLAEVFGGRVALMDLEASQALLGRQGWIDRIDVIVDPLALHEATERIAEAVSGRGLIRRSLPGATLGGSIVWSMPVALGGFFVLGTVLAILLCHAALLSGVDARLSEFSLLRSVGTPSAQLQWAVSAEAVVYAVCSAAIGFPGGVLLASGLIPVISEASATLQLWDFRMAPPSVTTLLVSAVAASVIVASAGFSLVQRVGELTVPGTELSRFPPSIEGVRLRTAGALALLVLAVLAAWVLPHTWGSGIRVGLILVLCLGAITVVSRALLQFVFHRCREAWVDLIPRIGRFVGLGLLSNSTMAPTGFAAIAGIVTVMTVTSLLFAGTRRTLDDLMAAVYADSIRVSAVDPTVSFEFEPIDDKIVDELRAVPYVVDVAAFEYQLTVVQGTEVGVVSIETSVLERRNVLESLTSQADEVARRLPRGDIAVSRGFAQRFDVEIGDSVRVLTDLGERTYRIAGLYRDFAGDTGSIRFDRSVFRRHFDSRGASWVAVWTATPTGQAIERIRRDVDQGLFFMDGPSVRQYAVDQVDNWRRLLRLPVGLVVVAVVCLLCHVLLRSWQRVREHLLLLRALGCSWRWIWALVILESGIFALVASLVGSFCGGVLLVPMTKVFSDVFGVHLLMDIDVSEVAAIILLPLAGIVIAAGLAIPASGRSATVLR